jgi:hypothetical protein
MEATYQGPGREGRIRPVSMWDNPQECMPEESIGGWAAGRSKEVDDLIERKPSRCSEESPERIAIGAMEWQAKLGPVLLIAASLWMTAGAPRPDRPEDSPVRAQTIILDDAPDHPFPGLPASEWPFLPANRGFDPRNGQNEPKDGEVAQDLPTRVVHRSDRSRGSPGSPFDPSSADRSPSEAADVGSSRPRAPRVGTVRSGEISSLLSRWWEYPTIARGRATAGLALQVPPPTQGRRPPVPEPQLAGVGLLTTAAGPAGAESR